MNKTDRTYDVAANFYPKWFVRLGADFANRPEKAKRWLRPGED